MATTEQSRVDNSQQYVDFDEFVGYHLSRTQSGIKYSEILTTLGWIATLGLAYLLVFTLLDHWFIDGGFSRGARVGLLVAAVAMGAGWFVWRVVVPYLRSINILYAARQIERSTPSLKGGLLNLVDLQHAGRRIPDHVRVAIEKHAALELSHVDVDQAVDRRPLMRVSYLLLIVITAFCLYALFSPKDILASVKRALLPTSSTAPPTRTLITSVDPGDVTVQAGEHVTVTVTISRHTPERVTLFYSTSDRKYLDEPVSMEQPDPEIPTFVAELAGENGRGLLENLTYRVEAGDDKKGDFKVTVVSPPSATVNAVAYEFPPYMEMENRTEPTGHISAHEGTNVRVDAETTIPVANANIVFVENDQPTGEVVRMTVTDGTRLSADWNLAIRDDGTFAPHYWIDCKTEDGLSDLRPTRYNVLIKPDLAPLIELLSPQSDLQMPANGIIPLLFRAADPDFRLRSVRLIAMKDGSVIVSEPLLDEDRPVKALEGRFEWKLEPLKLTPGDRLEFYLQAKDNRLPLANTKQTAKLNVQITEPVSEEEAQKQLEEEKEKQQEQQEQQDEAQADDEKQQDAAEEGKPQQDGQPQDGDQGEGESEQGKSGEGQPGDEESADGQPSDKQRQPGEEGDAAPEKSDDGEQSQGDQPGESGDPQDGDEQQERPLDPQNQQDQEEALKRILERQKEKEQQQNQQDQKPNQDGDKQDGDKQDGEKQDGEKQDGEKQDGENPGGDEKQPGQQKDGENAGQQDDNNSDTGEQGKNGTSPKDQGKPLDGTSPKGDPGADNADSDANPGDDSQPKNEPNSNNTAPGKGTDPSKPDQGSGQGNESDKKPDAEEPGKQDQNVEGTEEPADADPNAKKTDATGEETGQGKAADEKDAAAAKKKLDREGDKNENGRKPGDPKTKPQANEKGDPNDPAAKQAKPKPDAGKPSQPKKQQQDDPFADPIDDTKPKDDAQPNPEQKPTAADKKPDGEGENGQDSPEAKDGEQGKKGEKPPAGDNTADKPKPGAGDDAQQPGEKPEDQPGEKADGEPGKKSEGQPGEPSDAAADKKPGSDADDKNEPKEGGGKPGEPGQESSDKPGQGKSSQPGKGNQSPKGASGSGATSAPEEGAPAADGEGVAGDDAEGEAEGKQGEGEGGDSPPVSAAEQANLDYTKKATELVLDKINGDIERGEVDQKLLEELGWTEEQLREFSERMQDKLQRLEDKSNDTPAAIAERRQFEEMLKDLNPQTQTDKRSSSAENQQRVQQFDAKARKKVPLRYRSRHRAYTRSMSKDANAPAQKPAKPKSQE